MNDEPKVKVIAAGSLSDLLKELIGERLDQPASDQEITPEQEEFTARMQEKLDAECDRLGTDPQSTCVIFADTKDVHRAFHMISKGMQALMSHQDVIDGQKLAIFEGNVTPTDYKSIVKITIEHVGDSDFGKREHQH